MADITHIEVTCCGHTREQVESASYRAYWVNTDDVNNSVIKTSGVAEIDGWTCSSCGEAYDTDDLEYDDRYECDECNEYHETADEASECCPEEQDDEEEKALETTYKVWDIADALLGAQTPEGAPVARRVMFYGPPGCGKTFAACSLGLHDGQSVYSVTLTRYTEAVELQGQWMPDGRGGMVWMDGLAIRAWREGARLVINEIDHAGPDVQSFLHAVCDDPVFARYTLPALPGQGDPETVRPAIGFQAIATMNGAPNDLPEALKDRFAISLEVRQPNPAAVNALPEDLREMVRNGAGHSDEARRTSYRAVAEFGAIRGVVGDEVAASAVFGDRAPEILTALRVASVAV